MTKQKKNEIPGWGDIAEQFRDTVVEVDVTKIRPVNKRHRINDEYLRVLFADSPVHRDVAKLKIALKGIIPIRNSETRSVIPSNYIRRLSKITNAQYRQRKFLHPETGRLLVKVYNDGPNTYVEPNKKAKAKEEQLEKLRILDLEEKWEDKLAELEADLKLTREGIQPGMLDEDGFAEPGVDYKWDNEEEQEDAIVYLQYKIAKIQDALNQPITAFDDYEEDSDVSSQDTEEKK